MRLIALCLITFLGVQPCLANNPDTEREILELISRLESSDCQFERNGSRHDAKQAADHLRLKYRNGKRWVNSSEQFITRLASKSSWTGRAYFVYCGEQTNTSKDWLNQQLQSLRQGMTISSDKQ